MNAVERVEVVVVGAGAMGAASAWALGRAGVEAVVLERFEVGHARGSSHGPTRIFRFAYDDPLHVSMAQRALPLWRELERVAGRELLVTTGGLDFGPADYLSSTAAALRTCGAEADILDGAETRARFPGVDYGNAASLFSPDSGVLAASSCVAAMLDASGLPVRAGTEVVSLDAEDGGVIVRTASGAIAARRAIVTAGAWAGPLLGAAGVPLPLHVSREQVFYFAGPAQGVPVVIERGALMRYLVPPAFGAAGAKAGEHGTGERTTADGRSFEIDPEGQARVADWVASAFPALDAEPVAAETCLYTVTPDEQFVLDVAGPIVYASPCSGHGFKFAPLIGEALAALALDREPPFDVSPFGADRFGA